MTYLLTFLCLKVLLVVLSIIHPAWDGTQRSPFNVALLKLETKSKKSFPILLFDHFRLHTGQQVTAIGWGAGGKVIQVGSDIFGRAKIEMHELIAGEHCNRTALWDGSIPEGLLCGLNMEQQASCLGAKLFC